MHYLQVALVGIGAPLTYTAPRNLLLERGAVVRVPLGRGERVGVVLASSDTAPPEFATKLKAIHEAYPHLTLHPAQVALAEWLSNYYLHDVAGYLEAMIPPLRQTLLPERVALHHIGAISPRAKEMKRIAEQIAQGAIRFIDEIPAALRRKMVEREIIRTVPRAAAQTAYRAQNYAARLSDVQRTAWQAALATDRPVLLHGITGSGKTEIYFSLMDTVLAEGGSVIYLVPEINLTPLLRDKLLAVFGERVAVIHSQIGEAERYRYFLQMTTGEISIVVGARSALFAPMPHLKLIIVDEEHDNSYFQSESPVYHARDAALVRGQIEGARVILGSATPSLESYLNAEKGKYLLCHLATRFAGTLPQVEIIPPVAAREASPLGSDIEKDLTQTLAGGKQAIVFLNRRGFSPYAICQQCRTTLKCPHCDVSLTYHKALGKVMCHYCESSFALGHPCSECGSREFVMMGMGTERLEEYLEQAFGTYGVIRIDSDSAGTRTRAEALIRSFAAGEARLLVGTQMIAKGHHFPDVDMVVVLGVDALVNIPDFRAGERVFQLLTQVSGRAGRQDGANGRVVIQSEYAELPAMQAVLAADQSIFYQAEVDFRRDFGYPPFGRMALLGISGTRQDEVRRAIETLAEVARGNTLGVEVLGPTPFMVEQVRQRYQWKVLFKASTHRALALLLDELRGKTLPRALRLKIVVDPVGVG
ncbi:replication restart helicase PriA [Chrysiogenes arsenatis]|uniref:replication restart helicase PriA n=1 Tax=Chrysiogenes arsenatis TaxID=309797 RepID=UPI0004009993|nr:primosomal protein N' [Chrysiogenes arsenatis]